VVGANTAIAIGPHKRGQRCGSRSEVTVLACAAVARIPHIFHFVFGLRRQRSPFHLAHYLCLESCLQVNQPDQLLFHYREEPYGPYWERIRTRITPVPIADMDVVPALEYPNRGMDKERYAHESDFIRLAILLRTGGVYADIDTIFVNPLGGDLYEKPFVIGRESQVAQHPGEAPTAALCNAFLMAEPASEFARLWLDQMPDFFDGSWSAHSTQLPELLRAQHPQLLHVEPERSFYPYMWTREGIAALFEQLQPDFSGVYSMHLWAHLWWSRWRRDFSRFHAGALTEDYVRAARTTYALAAQPILAAASARVDSPASRERSYRARRAASRLGPRR
jgi:hypothetical protein